MPKRESFKHGEFSWGELATTDADAAKKFYGSLFGWTFDDQPAGPDMTYTMCKLGDDRVCALYEMGPQMKGTPPSWGSYVSVDDVDVVAKKAASNGGKLLKEPFDVMDVGRMAVVQDPTGAVINFWQAKKHDGAGVWHEPGAITWNELFTSDVDRAGKFYVQTLGWKAKPVDMGPGGTYTLFGRPDAAADDKNSVGGMMAPPPDMKGVPSMWLLYFAVSDCDASTAKAKQLGAKVLAGPQDIPNIGRFAILQDPQGAVFSLYKNAH